MADERPERREVQGLVVRGYGGLRAARYVLAEIVDPPAARAWLGGLDVATGADQPAERALNVALTAPGLAKLGLPDEVLSQFSHEFLEGMTTEHRRRILGDSEDSAPDRWRWGGPDGPPVHVLLLLYTRDDATAATVLAEQEASMAAGGLAVIGTLDTVELEPREHFGFRDGVSQPRYPALGPAEETPSAAAPRDEVKVGELVLGYRNEYDRFTPRPLVDDAGADLPADAEGSGRRDLGRDGTYLVFRQLAQDVEGFWRFCEEATVGADGAVDERARLRLAAKMVGRWPSGAPLVLAPDGDRPGLEDANDFAYFHEDPHGYGCPLGSHVRRANPRDMLDPRPGTPASVAVNKRHRILRRGRKYGSLLPRSDLLTAGVDEAWRDETRGLHFICLVANIARQFEFVQHSWLNDPRFGGLQDHPDPLMSPAPPGGRTFTVQAAPVRERHTGLPLFVSVRGGAYFFLPGVRALRYLATLGGAPR